MQFFFSRNESGGVQIKVNLENEKFNGKKAKFKFLLRATGQDEQRIDKVILENDFQVASQQMVFDVPAEKIQNWLYNGIYLHVYYVADVLVDGFFGEGLKGEAIFNDEKAFKVYTVTASKAPESAVTINFWKTFLIMSPLKKLLVLLAVGLILLTAVNMFPVFFGFHRIVFLTNYSVLAIILGGGVLLGCFVTATNFIKFQLVAPFPKIKRDSQLRLAQLISTSANIDLHGLSVELIGHVAEKYQYRSGGKNPRTRNAVTPVNYISVFNQAIDYLPKGASQESVISQTIDFEKFYSNLVPFFDITPEYGVTAQLHLFIHSKEFPDIGVILPMEAMEQPTMEMAQKELSV